MKNFLIIGGSSGIGKAIANNLADLGHRVFATFNKTTEQLHKDNISYYPIDVLDEMLDFSFIPATLDGLVYCPGSINLKPFHRISPADFAHDFQLQVNGAVKTLQAVLPNLKLADNPSILFFSTVAVQTGFTFHSQVAASKGAIEGLTRALAAELAPKIRVNAIAPSITDTPLAFKLLADDAKREANAQRHALKKIGKVEDLSEMASFLLSDKALWITGQVFNVDGGMSKVR